MELHEVVDLSLPVGASTQVYPGDPEVRFDVHSTIERDGFNLLSVRMGSQSGTHVDAPYHFSETGKRIDELPLERFAGPAVVVDATDAGARGRILWRHIQPVADRIRPGTIVLFRTGWSRHYGTDAYFENPFLDAGACAELIARGVRTFGLDASNIDETPDSTHPGEGFPVHHLIADVDGVICENLTRLDAVTFDDPFVSLLPIAFEAADGAPVRAVAMRLGA